MCLHDGRSQIVSRAAKVLLYFKDIYCSVTPVSKPLSQHFLKYLTSVLYLLCQMSLCSVSTCCQKPNSVTSRKGITLNALYFEGIYCSVTPVSWHLSQHFLNYLTSVLSLLSQMSLSDVSTWWQNPKRVTSRKRSTLLSVLSRKGINLLSI